MLKFQAIAEKMAKNFRGLLFFAAPCIFHPIINVSLHYFVKYKSEKTNDNNKFLGK